MNSTHRQQPVARKGVGQPACRLAQAAPAANGRAAEAASRSGAFAVRPVSGAGRRLVFVLVVAGLLLSGTTLEAQRRGRSRRSRPAAARRSQAERPSARAETSPSGQEASVPSQSNEEAAAGAAQGSKDAPAQGPQQPQGEPGSRRRAVTGRDTKLLPKLEEMQLPSAADLLQKPPVDWIVLKSGEVLVVNPVHPRPDTIQKLQQEREKLLANPPRLVRKPGESAAEYEARRRKTLQDYQDRLRRTLRLEVTLPDNVVLSEEEAADYYLLDFNKIDRIIYHEDLVLQRIDKLIDEGRLQTAYELLLVLERTAPGWPGSKQRWMKLSFAEAQKRAKKDAEGALLLLEQVHDEDPTFPGLQQELGRLFDGLIAQAVKQHDYRRARFFIQRLKRREPSHEVVVRWERRLQERAAELVSQAEEASRAGRHAEAAYLVEQAAWVWPLHTRVRTAYRRLAGRYPILRVGVVVLPGRRKDFPLPTRADERARQLTQLRLFTVDRFEEAAHYRTRFFDSWEPTDLGRQTRFLLRPRPAYWESQPRLSASDIVASLSKRLVPHSPQYDERLASYVSSLVVRSPSEFAVYFRRVPARLEALFALPAPVQSVWEAPTANVVPAPRGLADAADARPRPGGADDGGEARSGPAATLVAVSRTTSADQNPSSRSADRTTFPFYLFRRTDDEVVYRRTVPEPDDVPRRHVAEIVEKKYSSYREAVRGLVRGEVSLLPEVPFQYVQPLRDTKDYFILRYAVPTTHVVQIHPRSWLQKSRAFRRALIYGADRERILKEVVLQGQEQGGRVVTGVVPSNSSAYNKVIQPFPYNRILAVALATVGVNQLGGKVPPLRMVCDPDPICRQAAARLVENWQQAGIQVELVEDAVPDEPDPTDPDAPAPWDLAYRRVRMTEPWVQLWPFLVLRQTAEVGSLMKLPVWLRQKIIALDNVSDWPSAVQLLQELQKDLYSQVLYIPLWEVDEVLVVRKNIQGVPVRPVGVYQNVERWQVEPWYPTKLP